MKYKRIHLESGNSFIEDIELNYEFQQSYGHIQNPAKLEQCARILVNDWNRRAFVQGKQQYVYIYL